MMADLGSGLQQLLRSLGASGVQAARSQRVAEVHVRWKCAVEAVYRDSAPLVLDHTNGVYIMKPEQANDPMAARVPAGKTLLVVYCDDAMIRSDIDARQEMLKIRLNEQGRACGPVLHQARPLRHESPPPVSRGGRARRTAGGTGCAHLGARSSARRPRPFA